MNKKFKTVGLMTMSNVINFGSALQTYATVKVVESLGFYCEVIDYAYPSIWHINNAVGGENNSSVNTCKKIIKWILRKIGLFNAFRVLLMTVHRISAAKTERVFADFLHKIPVSKEKYDRKTILKNPPRYDIYMTGSDQTWNPRYMHTDYSYLLNFAPEKSPKIAYAASFGATEIQAAYRSSYAEYLKKYDYISVREKSGIPLVAELSGKKAWHTPDPTLMLNKEEWGKLNQNKLGLPDKFIFAYILDYVFNPYPHVVEFLNHLSKISNMPVVFYGADVRTLGGDYRYVDNSIGPDGFVECFANASFVVTTSFHGSAYSVNFEKDFFVVLNHTSSKDDRVKSFLASVGLENRGLLLPQLDISSIAVEDMKTDHTKSRVCLRKMREDSREYLKEALDFAVRKIEGA